MAASLLLHGLVALALAAYLEYAPQPDVLATLDLSSVELSFAEREQETRPVAAPPPPTVGTVPCPPQEEKPPEIKPERPLPPDPAAPKLPEPQEEPRRFLPHPSSPVPPAAPRQARLDAPPRPRRNIRPDYPKGARQRGEQGEVVLEIRVDADGAVGDVTVAVSSGYAELDEAAVKAVRSAKFSPARSGRAPVASVAQLKLQFKLR